MVRTENGVYDNNTLFEEIVYNEVFHGHKTYTGRVDEFISQNIPRKTFCIIISCLNTSIIKTTVYVSDLALIYTKNEVFCEFRLITHTLLHYRYTCPANNHAIILYFLRYYDN